MKRSNRPQKYIEELIEALKQLRQDVECLINMLGSHQEVLSLWTHYFLELSKARVKADIKPFSLPQNERKKLKKYAGSELLEKYEAVTDDLIRDLMSGDIPSKLAEMRKALKEIDNLIVDLSLIARNIKSGKKSKIQQINKIMLNVDIAYIAVGMIVVNWQFENWSTIATGLAMLMAQIKSFV